MSCGSVEADFERWRELRDLDALAEVFDAVAPELLRVARHLVADAAAAEDLLQATFLEVLKHPQRFRRGARLVPWLVGILTRQAGRHRRAAARRADPARAARRREPAPEERLAEHELSAAVQHALDGLREPYASVVRAHLQDGVRPAEIAARLACAPATIRMQLCRGLAMLRRALPFGLAIPLVLGRAEAIARVRDAVLARAATLPVGASAATILLTWLGATLMKKVLVVAAMLVFACGMWITLAADPSAPLAPAAGAANAPSAVASAPAGPPRESERALEGTPAAAAGERRDAGRVAADATSPPGLWLVGTVTTSRRIARELPVVTVGVWGHVTKLQAEVLDDGRYRIDLTTLVAPPPPAQVRFDSGLVLDLPMLGAPTTSPDLHIVASHPLCMPRTTMLPLDLAGWQPGQRRELRQDFLLVAASVVTGRVEVDHEPLGVAVALFDAARLTRSVAEPNATDGVDATGTFTLRSEVDGEVEVWIHHPEAAARAVRARAVLGQRTDLGTIRLDRPGSGLAGVLEAPAELLQGATLHVEQPVLAGGERCATTFHGLSRVAGQMVCTSRAAETDERGAFVVHGLDRGPWRLRLAALAAMPLCPADPGTVLEVPAAGVRIGGDRRVRGVIVHGDRGPLAGIAVRVAAGDDTVTLTTDADGHARWFGTAVDYVVRVEHLGWAPCEARLAAADHDLAPELRMTLQAAATAAMALSIEDTAARSERTVQIGLFDDRGNLVWERQGTIPDGPWSLDDLPAGRFRMVLRPLPASGIVPPVAALPTATIEREVVLQQGERTAVHVLRPLVGRLCIEARFDLPAARAGGRVEILDARGVKVRTTTVTEIADGWREGPGLLDLRGGNVIRPDLPVGSYTVVIGGDAVGTTRHAIEIRAGETTTLTLEP